MVARQTLTLFVWVQILVPQPYSLGKPRLAFFEVWLSLVERYVRDVEVAGSNPVTSTNEKPHQTAICRLFGAVFLYSKFQQIIGNNMFNYKICGTHVAFLLTIGTHESESALFPEIY